MKANNWRDDLLKDGYAFFHNLTPEPLVMAVRQAIERDLHEHYDLARQMEYDYQSYCPDLRGAPVITALLRRSLISNIIEEALGWDNINYDGGQIAIRRAHNSDRIVPPWPHLDGIPTEFNGLYGDEISNFTALVGVFLTKTPRAFAGNFTVWPGSHLLYERYFRQRGRRAMREGMPAIEVGAPVQLMCDAGDVVLCHYQLGHNAAVNTSDIERQAIYFRIWLRDMDEHRWHRLTHIWDGWKI